MASLAPRFEEVSRREGTPGWFERCFLAGRFRRRHGCCGTFTDSSGPRHRPRTVGGIAMGDTGRLRADHLLVDHHLDRIFRRWASSGLGGYIAGRLRTRWPSVHLDEVYFRDIPRTASSHGPSATLLTAAALTSVIGTVSRSGFDGRSRRRGRWRPGGRAGAPRRHAASNTGRGAVPVLRGFAVPRFCRKQRSCRCRRRLFRGDPRRNRPHLRHRHS